MLNFQLRGNYIVLTDTDKPRKEFTGLAKDVIIRKDDELMPNFYVEGLNNWSVITAIPFSRIDGFTTIEDFVEWYSANTGEAVSNSEVATETTLSALNSKTPTVGQKTMALSSPVTIASNQSSIPVTQSGSWTINPGNLANTTPWLANQVLPAILTTGDTGAKVSSGNGSSMNNTTSKGLNIVFNLGTVSGTLPTCVFKIQGSSDGGNTWYDVPNANTATLTATGFYGIQVYPGISNISGTTVSGTVAQVNAVLPRTWRVAWTIGGTNPSFTITNIQVSYII